MESGKSLLEYVASAELSVRANNVLMAKIMDEQKRFNLHDFLDWKEGQIAKTRNVGRKTVKELLEFQLQVRKEEAISNTRAVQIIQDIQKRLNVITKDIEGLVVLLMVNKKRLLE